ncbi:MAG: hypothetical protein KDG89_12920 [Geminicoccaceae bacterium]|nr:hypothetical protein [Geminicoccaceae bacterium]
MRIGPIPTRRHLEARFYETNPSAMQKTGITVSYTTENLAATRARVGDENDRAKADAMSEAEPEASIAADPDWRDVPPDWYEQAKAGLPFPVPILSRFGLFPARGVGPKRFLRNEPRNALFCKHHIGLGILGCGHARYGPHGTRATGATAS